MRSTGIVCVAACLAVLGSPARAERLVLGDIQAEADLADEANAVVLLVRTALTKDDQLVLSSMTAATPDEIRKLHADHAVFLELAHEKTGLGVTIAIADTAGGIEISSVHAGDGDVVTLATGVVDHVFAATRADFRPVPTISFGALRPYAEAIRLHDPAAAIAALADSNPTTAIVVTAINPALRDLTSSAPTAASRMFVARAIGARDVIDKFLSTDPKDGSPNGQLAAVVKTYLALDHADVGKADAAIGKAGGGEANLARAVLAERHNDRARLSVLLTDALKGDLLREALALTSTLPLAHLTPALQQIVLELAERQQAISPAVAGRIGLEAASLGIDVARGLALVAPRELDRFEVERLTRLLGTLKETAPKVTVARLNAEISMRNADGNEAVAIEAYLGTAPADPRARLYNNYLGAPVKPPRPSTVAPVVKPAATGSAHAPVTDTPKAEPESVLFTVPVLAGAGGGLVLLLLLLLFVVVRRRKLPRAATVPAPPPPPRLMRLRVVVEAEPPQGIGVWTTDRRKRMLTDSTGEATIELPIGNHEIRFDIHGEVITRSVTITNQGGQRLVVDLRRSTGLANPADLPIEPAVRAPRVEPAEIVPPIVILPEATVLAHADTASIEIPVEPTIEPEPEFEEEPERVPKRASMFEIANPGTVPGHIPASMARTPAPMKHEIVRPAVSTPTLEHTAPPPVGKGTGTTPKLEPVKPLLILPEPVKTPKPEPAKPPVAKPEPPVTMLKSESTIVGTPMPKVEPAKPAPPAPKPEPAKIAKLPEPVKVATPKPPEPAKSLAPKPEPAKPAPVKAEAPKPVVPKPEPAKPKPEPAKAKPEAIEVAKLDVELDPGPFSAAGPGKRPPAPAKPTGKRGQQIDTPMEFELSAAGAGPMVLETEMPVAPELELAPSTAAKREPRQFDPNKLPPVMDFELDDAPKTASGEDEDVPTAVRGPLPTEDTRTTQIEPAPPDPATIDTSETIEPPSPMPVRSRTQSVELEDLPGDPTAITAMDLPREETSPAADDPGAPLPDDPTAITTSMAPGHDDENAEDRENTAVSPKNQPVAAPPRAPVPTPILHEPTPRPSGPPRLGRYLRYNEVTRGPKSPTVFRGYDERNRRDVGIEALPPVLDPIASASLVTSLAKFEHANLVHVYELIVHAGKPYLITEPLAGKSLDQHIIDRGVYPWLEAVGLMDEVCAGLEYAHERSMLHRAIRPAVIIMQGKAAKLGGFAIAPDLTDADFVAPDVLSGAAPGRRSDIYAIGATLFQCLTGRSPSKDHELSNVPMKLQQLVDSMLAKTANDRPATVKDVRVSFKGLLDF